MGSNPSVNERQIENNFPTPKSPPRLSNTSPRRKSRNTRISEKKQFTPLRKDLNMPTRLRPQSQEKTSVDPEIFQDLRKNILSIQLPVCTKGQNHYELKYVCADEKCAVEDQLKLLCKKCLEGMLDENIISHVQIDIKQALISLTNQIDNTNQKNTKDLINQGSKNSIRGVIGIDCQFLLIEDAIQGLIYDFVRHIQNTEKIVQNLEITLQNIKKSKEINNQIQDLNEVQKLLENINQNSSERNLMLGFKKLKSHIVVLQDSIRIVDINKIINRNIDNQAKSYFDEIVHKLQEIDSLTAEILQVQQIHTLDNLQAAREEQRIKLRKRVAQQKLKEQQLKLSTKQEQEVLVQLKKDQEEQKLQMQREEENRQIQLQKQQQELDRQRQIEEEQYQQEKQKQYQEQQRLRQLDEQRKKDIEYKKQMLYSERNHLVILMEDHVRNCDNTLCRGVQWGMETEYKFIGISDEILQDGRKKTICAKGKDLNHEMKEIVRKIKLAGE